MEETKLVWVILSIFLVIAAMPILLAQTTDVLSIEADIILPVSNSSNESLVSILIDPDSINLGEAVIGKLSEEESIVINNTGTVKVVVTSELVDNDNIFKYLQLRDSSSSFKSVEDFSTNVTTKKTIDIRLDLRDFNEDLEDSIIDHSGQVRFLAMAA